MKLRSEKANVRIDTDVTQPRFSAGEGDIYVIPPSTAAKVYHTALLTRDRQEKVLALCSKFGFYCGILNRSRLAFPQFPMANADDNEIVGFGMRFFGELPPLANIGFDLQEGQFKHQDGNGLSDDLAVKLVYDLYEALESFRRANVALGDIHPDNILYDWKLQKPVFVDLDSAQIEGFPVTAFKADYVDPLVTISDGGANFSYLSDRFSMAVVAYELLVGRNPFFLHCDPNEGIEGNKRLSVSLLGYHGNAGYLTTRNVSLINHAVDRRILERLNTVRHVDMRLYQYLSDVLLGTCRDSLLQRLPRNDPRHPANIFAPGSSTSSLAVMLQEGRQAQRKETPNPGTVILNPEEILGILREYALKKETLRSSDPDNFIAFVADCGFDYVQMRRQGSNVV